MNFTSRLSLPTIIPFVLALAAPAMRADDGYGPKRVHHTPSPCRAPAELAPGTAFIDRILPLSAPPSGLQKSPGGPNVNPRVVANGHMDRPHSEVVYAASDDPAGPFVVRVTVPAPSGTAVFSGVAPAIAPYGAVTVRLTSFTPLPAGELPVETVVDADGEFPEKGVSRLTEAKGR